MRIQRLLGLLWPAFIAACVLQLMVFALVDPLDILWAGAPIGWSRPGVYTAAFFAFWTICAASSAITALLSLPGADINRLPPA